MKMSGYTLFVSAQERKDQKTNRFMGNEIMTSNPGQEKLAGVWEFS